MMRWRSSVLLAGAVLATPARAAQVSCSRDGFAVGGGPLHRGANRGRRIRHALATGVGTVENMRQRHRQGRLHTPLKIDFHRSLLDTDACETFTEVIVTDINHPYVFGFA